MQTITGNTYAVKERLKAMGGRWNSAAQGWDMPDDQAEAARAIVAAAPASVNGGRRGGYRSRYQSNVYRFSGGGEMYVNKRGRCEDAPCCGCCS
jgi:hypothetical protein